MDDPGVDVQEIADRLELGELLARYVRAVDGGDWALLDSVFTADAVIDFSATGGIRATAKRSSSGSPRCRRSRELVQEQSWRTIG